MVINNYVVIYATHVHTFEILKHLKHPLHILTHCTLIPQNKSAVYTQCLGKYCNL